jgi:hypothetical protein
MKALVEFPAGIHHIDQMRCKVVRIRDDAPERYAADGRWRQIAEPDKNFGIRCLEASRGRECVVFTTNRRGGDQWYELLFDPPVEVENVLGSIQKFPYLHITADYVRVIDHGFMEAR